MAIVLDSNLKVGIGTEKEPSKSKFYPEGTPLKDLTKAHAKIAKEAGILVQREDPAELEEALAELEDDEETEDEDE